MFDALCAEESLGLWIASTFCAYRQKRRREKAEQQLGAAVAKAASDTARWREEVELKQARIDMLVAGDRAKEADFMSLRIKDLQVPCPALPCPALPCPALPCPALPCPALPCLALCRCDLHSRKGSVNGSTQQVVSAGST